MNYQDINAQTIDRWIEEGWEWGIPIDHETYLRAKNGMWDVLLTPTKFVPHAWFGELKGKKVLGLASGGGQQMPIFAARVRIVQCLIIRNVSLPVKLWWRNAKDTRFALFVQT